MSDQRNPADAFTAFWNEFMTRAGGSGGTSPSFGEGAKQMQRMFFDTMAKYAEEFMRSEQFLSAMKQTMDQSLQMKKLFDDFLVKAQHGMQAPVKGDVDDIAALLRNIESRLITRLDRLEEKVAAVEAMHDQNDTGEKRAATAGSRTQGPNRNRKK